LDVDHGETFSGDAASKFKPAGVFNFIPVKILAPLNPGAPQGPNATETEMLPGPVGDEDNPN
jgi:hypothetical protein